MEKDRKDKYEEDDANFKTKCLWFLGIVFFGVLIAIILLGLSGKGVNKVDETNPLTESPIEPIEYTLWDYNSYGICGFFNSDTSYLVYNESYCNAVCPDGNATFATNKNRSIIVKAYPMGNAVSNCAYTCYGKVVGTTCDTEYSNKDVLN